MMTNLQKIRVGWKVSSLSLGIASVRYRALLPLLALHDYECESTIFSSPDPRHLQNLDILIVVKPITPYDYSIAQIATSRGIPVIFDLCDNIFIEKYKSKFGSSPANLFLAYAKHASAIVVTTTELSNVLAQKLTYPVPIYVIPDGIEIAATLKRASVVIAKAKEHDKVHALPKFQKLKRLMNHLKTASIHTLLVRIIKQQKKNLIGAQKKLRSKIKQSTRHFHWLAIAKKLYNTYVQVRDIVNLKKISPSNAKITNAPRPEVAANTTAPKLVKRILWFGNHGAPHAKFGMLDLLDIRDDLERIASEFPVELVVVSNNPKKFDEYIKPFSIPSRYVEWSEKSIRSELKSADVVILPNSLDAFSRCKSANRTVLALAYNVPVVATFSPALADLKECIQLNDFYSGIKCYFTCDDTRQQHLAYAKTLIERHFGQQIIGQKWRSVLDMALRKQNIPEQELVDIIVFLHLQQDLDLALPILQEADARKLNFQVWCSALLAEKCKRTIDRLLAEKWAFRIIPDDPSMISASLFSEGVKSLLCVVETNLGPHQIARRITEIGNKLGVYTATIQHGFENVGLTYDDELHSIRKITFASKRIYLWGSIDTLHKDVEPGTRIKCFPVGCPKPAKPAPADLGPQLSKEKPIVGIFENLHWHRYSDDYRDFFLAGIDRLITEFPNVTFLIKPHNAGMWLTSRYQGEIPQAHNLVIANPNNGSWAAFTANDLLGNLTAVITTPSTVALDAARYELPVAVVQHSLLLENYSPVFAICHEDDWSEFIRNALQPNSATILIDKARQFVANSLIGNSAASKIIDDLVHAGTEHLI